MGYGLLAALALIPALGMGVIGVFSAGPARRPLLLFFLCGFWVASAALVFALFQGGAFFGLLCLAQAAAGLAGWLGSSLTRFASTTDLYHPHLPGPPSPPRA